MKHFKATTLHSLAVGLVLPSGLSAFGLPRPGQTTSKPSSQSSLLTRLFSSASDEGEVLKKDQTFKTWSYDGPCTSMEWSTLIGAEMSLVAADSVDAALEADLIMVGIAAPKKSEEDEAEEKEDEDKEKEEPVVGLVGLASDLEAAMGGEEILSSLISENNKEFKNGAKAGSTTPTTRIVVNGKAKRVMFVGLGAPKSDDDKKKKPESVGAAVGKALASTCQSQKKVAACTVIIPESLASDIGAMQDLSAAFYQTLYADNRYKSKSSKKKVAEDLTSVQLLCEGSISEEAQAAIVKGKQLATGIFLTKDIVNAPHNVLNSLSLADTARRIADESLDGCITCQILDKDECEARGMGAFLGVARGSETEPQFIHLTYKPPTGDVKKKVGIVGKGLLFDTGGYNIKTQMMQLMKFDCGGAAAVLGAARAVGAMQPEGVEAHFLVAACENMINGKAVVPSDILTASNGKTIEVLNTDAEGRLTLADALVYADKEVGAESIIELSTLTGACMISLGKSVAGVWTADDDLATELDSVSKKTGDKTWRMPLVNEYMEQLTGGNFADLKNIGAGPYGGAITAALFLTEFVDKKKPFAHIDIAGPVWDDKSGATGYGAKLVTEWVQRQGE